MLVPVDRRTDAGAHRLGERFLGGEALGEIGRGLAVCRRSAPARRGTRTRAREALAAALERLLDARDLDDVGADAEDHLRSIAARMRR